MNILEKRLEKKKEKYFFGSKQAKKKIK